MNDSFKWSIDIDNWPYCANTAFLDLSVAVKSRGGKPNPKNSIGDGSTNSSIILHPLDAPEAAGLLKRNITSADRSRHQALLQDLALITTPINAALDYAGDNGVAINVPITLLREGYNFGRTEHQNYRFPVIVNTGTANVTVTHIHYDPSFEFATNSSGGASPAVIGGIVAGVVVGLALLVGGVFFFKKRSTPSRI